MNDVAFALFETAIGPCGIVWTARGVRGVLLPEATPRATRARLATRFCDAREMEPPPAVRAAIDGIVALLAGERRDLGDVVLDLEGITAFASDVYAIARSIPAGATLTYGEIATRLGDVRRAREVGQALGNNPFPLIVPCHRVVAAGGKDGGFSAPGGVATKLRLLGIEGAAAAPPTLFDIATVVPARR
jgi:methylated-DNA-[protein]-cysteine S-methyltransferase